MSYSTGLFASIKDRSTEMHAIEIIDSYVDHCVLRMVMLTECADKVHEYHPEMLLTYFYQAIYEE